MERFVAEDLGIADIQSRLQTAMQLLENEVGSPGRAIQLAEADLEEIQFARSLSKQQRPEAAQRLGELRDVLDAALAEDAEKGARDDVRTEHVLYGDATGSGHLWSGLPGKTPFPSSWSGAKTMHVASDIATDPNATVVSSGRRVVLAGTRDGVDIRVVVDYQNNDIISAYPTNLPRNP